MAGTAPLARETPPIASPAPPAAAAHANDAGAAAPEPSSPQPSPQPSPNVEPAPQTVTAPSFGAAYLHNPAPPYPALAQQRGWQGTVLLKVHVLASGRPDHVSVTSSSGHDSLDDAASEAIANWSFVPARRGEQAVDGWVQVPIEFKLGT
ncbi:MAG: energy transducer TonB [Paraburkholderia sp.]|nr:energy transducer TonB [Paraburkholderia sp.]